MKNNENYVASFRGRQVDLFDYDGRPVRRFTTKADVVNAVVTGSGQDAKVAITMKDGHYIVYTSSGRVYRQN